MDSLQTLTIKNIINNISDNEQLLSIKKVIDYRYNKNINHTYRLHYCSKEEGKFNNRICNSKFVPLYNGGYHSAIEYHKKYVEGYEIKYGVEYLFNNDNSSLFINHRYNHDHWELKGTYDNYTIIKTTFYCIPKEILEYGLFLWKYKV